MWNVMQKNNNKFKEWQLNHYSLFSVSVWVHGLNFDTDPIQISKKKRSKPDINNQKRFQLSIIGESCLTPNEITCTHIQS